MSSSRKVIEVLISTSPLGAGYGPALRTTSAIKGNSSYSFNNIIIREDVGDVKETRTTETPAFHYNSGFLSQLVDLREVITFSHFFHHLKCQQMSI